ncbi:MAG: hypothetical protein ABJH52_09870 [Henriciella sp.]
MIDFVEDEFVQVLAKAPDKYGPGLVGIAISIAKCVHEDTVASTGIPIGDLVIWVGLDRGNGVEAIVIPSEWLVPL